MPKPQLPREVLTKVSWTFSGHEYTDVKQFLSDALEAQDGRRNWNPDEVAIPVPVVRIFYTFDSGEDLVDSVIEIKSSNGEVLYAGELLFKIHNSVVRHLSDVDHCYFQGLILNTGAIADTPPLYRIWLGS